MIEHDIFENVFLCINQVEDKILALVNDDLSLEPPLELAEIEVAHRLPHPRRTAPQRSQGQGPLPQVSAADHTDTTSPVSSSADRGPRMVIVKFANRRVKSRVMDVRKELRNLDEEKYPRPIYFQDDLTARRAKIAYQARQGKKAGKLMDTWVIDSKVMVKDRNNRIHQVRTQKDIEHFYDFFINIGPTVAEKIPKQSELPEAYLGSKIENSIMLVPDTLTEIEDIFKTLRWCSPGYDETTTDIINLSLPYIKNPLLRILNQSLLQGVFPTELKVANVIPLFKADDLMKLKNYRPVSLLSILSKIFANVMYDRIIDFWKPKRYLWRNNLDFGRIIQLIWHLWSLLIIW